MTPAQTRQVALALETTPLEIEISCAAGDIVINDSLEPLPGFHSIRRAPGGGYMHLKRHAYLKFINLFTRKRRDLIRECRRMGLSFGATKGRLSSKSQEEIEDALKEGGRSFEKVTITKIPLLGHFTEVILDLVHENHCTVLGWCVQPVITPEVEAVVELGCGTGDLIVSLARDYASSKTRFIAADLSRYSVECALDLAAIAGLTNVDGVEFDMEAPNFDFLSGYKNVLFVSSAAISMVETYAELFEAMVAREGAFRICAFEPLGTQISSELPGYKSVLIPELCRHGLNLNLWQAVQPFLADGRLKLERLVPDISGRHADYPMTLMQLARLD